MRSVTSLLLCLLATSGPLSEAAPAAAPDEHATVAAARFSSILPPTSAGDPVELAAFRLDRRPVTNAEYLAFVTAQPKWRRDRVAALFADASYLSHWEEPLKLGAGAEAQQPVTNVSWFAAKAYCEARGERLPTWYEWEYVAAAGERELDSRSDPAWRQEILDWYAQPSGARLPAVGRSPANAHGVFDMHGLVWEWVLDYNALLVSNDSRDQGGADRAQFCAEGALSAADRENYAVLMRIAFLSSLEARYTVRNLGFRCAADEP